MDHKAIIEYHLAKAVLDGIVPTDAWKLWKSENTLTASTVDALIKAVEDLKSKPCTSCGKEVERNKETFLGVQKTKPEINYELDLHNCPSCNSTVAFRRLKKPEKSDK